MTSSVSQFRIALLGPAGRLLVPFAFAIFPFSFAMQVVSGTELLGIMPYLFLVFSALLVCLSSARFGRLSHRGMAGVLDILVSTLILWSLAHALAGIVSGASSLQETARVILIYVASAWVYFYVVFRSGERDHQDILIATTLSTLVLGLHWCVETYSKFVLQRTSMYQILTHDYIMRRNAFNFEQVNSSVLNPEYRAYGLTDKHTTTGALVGLGGFTTIGWLSGRRLDWRLLAGFGFLAMLTVGMATLAWLSFMLLVPVAILLSERLVAPGRVVVRGLLYSLALGLVILALVAASGHAEDLLNKIVELFGVQLSFVLNVDGTSAQTSWWQIYSKETEAFGQYLAVNPWAAVFGEGYSGYGPVHFYRGGDVAAFEFLATYGFPLTLFFLVGVVGAMVSSAKVLMRQSASTRATGFLTLACVGLAFLLISLGHYNTFFNKSVYVYFFLFIGLARRYACELPERSDLLPSVQK